MGGKEEIQCLKQENCRLKSDLIKQLELAECLAEKLDTRDEEIKRLSGLLEGGRPLEALNTDCCFKEVSSKLAKINEENCRLKCSNEDLELQLAEAIRKQHEAMKRALMLADRNKELERELHDIDQMALAVEAECNCKVKENIDRVTKCQQELDMANQKIEMLERQLSESRRKQCTLDTDYGNAREEKENLHRILETALDDKRRMTDRMNQFQKIEYDLNHEIDKLASTCTCQKRKIADLELQLINQKVKGGKSEKVMSMCKCKEFKRGDHSPEKQSRGSSPGKQSRGSSPGKQSRGSSPSKLTTPKKGSKESAAKNIDKNKGFIEKLTKERNEFQNKCKTLQEQLAKLNSNQKISPSKMQGGDSLKRNLKEKDDKISKLEKNIQNLTREKHELMTKLEETKKWGDDKGTSLKSGHLKAEKERDMARGDCKRLEEERDALRQRLKQVSEAHAAETEKLQILVRETEKKLQQVENERREMMSVQGNRRATINNLEEKVETLSSQLRTAQSELDHIKTTHSQLKTLHEQTDRALADSQGHLNQVECEYAKACNKIRDLDKDRVDMECQCSQMRQDLTLLKTKLTSIDGERDNLLIEIDNKTERIANLEMELNSRQNKMMTLEKMVTELQQKLSSYTDEISSKEYLLKNNSAEINTVRRTLDDAMKDKQCAMMENKRLQEDFAKAAYECKCVNGELDRAKREIDDLKTQLQQYVYEIKRAEDLISKKEIERSEMLDQFRNLSEETTVLETNNHTLESQAIEVRNQLSTATNHIHDLESTIQQYTTLNKDYEKQINQMTKQIASLETQVRQSGTINKNVESEIADMKCLCVKLDEQKDTLKKEVKQRNDYTNQLEIEKEHLKLELNNLQDALHKETSNIGSLENLLATCRQETVEQRLLNQELQSEIHRLKNMVQELQQKLRNGLLEPSSSSSSNIKHCIHLINEKRIESRTCCTPKTCPKLNQSQYEIPEKTIFDEVCLHKTLYCSGTQQNLLAHPEQRNVGIQQIFRNKPEYIERTNESSEMATTYRSSQQRPSEINEVSLNRFYVPTTKPPSPPLAAGAGAAAVNQNICGCNCSKCTKARTNLYLAEQQNRNDIQNEESSRKNVCGDGELKHTYREQFPSKKEVGRPVGKKSVYIETDPIIEESIIISKPSKQQQQQQQRQRQPVSSVSEKRHSSPPILTTFREKDSPRKTKTQSIANVKFQPVGSVRNSAFWRDGDDERTPKQSLQPLHHIQNIPHSEPAIRKKPSSKVQQQQFRSYQSETPINALDHDTFHSDTPEIVVKPPKELILSEEEEADIRRSRRKSRAATLQKVCLLRKTLNLNDSRTRLIYRTELPNTNTNNSPFRSNYTYTYNSGINTSRSDDDHHSDTIIVIPETCKQNIVDSPKSVTFSCNTRCQTVDDIDAKCRELLQLNLNDEL